MTHLVNIFERLLNTTIEIHNYSNIQLKYISNENDRLLLFIENNLNTNNNLLIIAKNVKLNTKYKIIENQKVNIVNQMLLYHNKNIYDNIFVMNILSNDNNKNLIIYKKIFELYPNINILLCYGDDKLKKKNNDILRELDKIFIEQNFYENKLVKCFYKISRNNPCCIIQKRYLKKEFIKNTILEKDFNEYFNYIID
jgi:hypothetical protein